MQELDMINNTIWLLKVRHEVNKDLHSEPSVLKSIATEMEGHYKHREKIVTRLREVDKEIKQQEKASDGIIPTEEKANGT